jgi:hypothetical protein
MLCVNGYRGHLHDVCKYSLMFTTLEGSDDIWTLNFMGFFHCVMYWDKYVFNALQFAPHLHPVQTSRIHAFLAWYLETRSKLRKQKWTLVINLRT